MHLSTATSCTVNPRSARTISPGSIASVVLTIFIYVNIRGPGAPTLGYEGHRALLDDTYLHTYEELAVLCFL